MLHKHRKIHQTKGRIQRPRHSDNMERIQQSSQQVEKWERSMHHQSSNQRIQAPQRQDQKTSIQPHHSIWDNKTDYED